MGRKWSLSINLANSSRRPRQDSETDSNSSTGIVNFDPTSIVQSKDGTLKVLKTIIPIHIPKPLLLGRRTGEKTAGLSPSQGPKPETPRVEVAASNHRKSFDVSSHFARKQSGNS